MQWVGNCEADKIAKGTYDVPAHESGNYALVFDNTFSRQLSKTLTLVLITYPTAMPPPQLALTPPANHAPSLAPQDQASTRKRANSGNKRSAQSTYSTTGEIHTGILHKRRRRRHQGWARRFFALDCETTTFSYYHDRNTSTLRGSIPLSLAAIATNEKSREISVDSGAEIWHLRAGSDEDFFSWKRALEKASSKTSAEGKSEASLSRVPSYAPNPAEDREWDRVRSLVSQLTGSRDFALRLAKDTDPKYLSAAERPRGRSPSSSSSLGETNGDDSIAVPKRPFWKRKSSAHSHTDLKRAAAPNSSSNLTVPVPGADAADRKPGSFSSHPDHAEGVHDRLMGLLHGLDKVVSEFGVLMAESKQRRHPAIPQARRSMESDVSQEFYDANDGGRSPLLTIQDSDEDADDDDAAEEAEEEEADDAPSDSEEESPAPGRHHDHAPLFPTKPKSLTPLPVKGVTRRDNVKAPTVMPPSLIGFLRKNVGKDLSQISMPVSANEPFSLLQRSAEVLEYSSLLDSAAGIADGRERLLYVTAFAISSLSSARVRERAIRKPFNPMLGETYELVREDRGFRFIAEKVSHRPVQLAYLADSKDWSLTQSPMPSQKFWGKSAEIVTEGKFRLTIHSTGEHFSWSGATSFLRNIIAGEKYVEPVGELSVVNETSGQKTITAFKSGGMFSGRSEEISTKLLDSHGTELPLGLTGTWISSMSLTKNGSISGSPIWEAGSLVPNAAKHYGLTSFAATLNEVTPIEEHKLPATDSRLRPDQRALEDGDLDEAEAVKVKLEEAQRARRREMEGSGKSWTPRWFAPVEDGNGDVTWRFRGGKDGYWEERAKGAWGGVVPVFKT